MSRAILNEKSLAKRGMALQRLLRPISKYPDTGPKWVRRSIRRDVIVGAQDELIGFDDHRNWYFYTLSEDFIAQYYEIWKQLHGLDWYLYRAYLNIFQLSATSNNLQEFVCLHCDPSEGDPPGDNKYKIGPHLHIIRAEHPIPKSHIALNACHLDDVMNSVESLFSAFQAAIVMIRDEIILR